jgi:hypothetical protein
MMAGRWQFLFILFICLFTIPEKTSAQKIKKEDYFFIDALVQKAGPMKGFGLQYIVDSITKECKTELQMTRAFYYWQTHFVPFDRRRKTQKKSKDDASSALMERKAASHGLALMFQAMCALKKIDCSLVAGTIRYRLKDIGQFDPDEIHYWNIVTINNTQYLIDVSLGIGSFDEKGKHMIPSYTDAWWLCNRKLFASSHFPEHPKQQLLEVPINKKEFSHGPIVWPGAIVAGLIPSRSSKGIIRAKQGDSTNMLFNFAGQLNVRSVEMSIDDASRIPLNYDFDEFGLSLKLEHPKAGKHKIALYFNNSLAFVYVSEVRKNLALKKQQ